MRGVCSQITLRGNTALTSSGGDWETGFHLSKLRFLTSSQMSLSEQMQKATSEEFITGGNRFKPGKLFVSFQ